MIINVYKDFIRTGAITDFTSFEWIRKYSQAGVFTLTLPFTAEYFKLLEIGSVIINTNTGEAARINARNVLSTKEGERTLIIKGLFLSSILNKRVIKYVKNTTLKNAVNEILQTNVINPTKSNRKISNFRILSDNISLQNVSLDISNKTIYETFKELFLKYNIGFTIDYNRKDKTYDFRLYEGQDKNVFFDIKYNNVIEQDYYFSDENYKNTVIIDDFIYGDENVGIDRNEISTSRDSNENTTLVQEAQLFLLNFTKVEAFDAIINPKSPQFEYKIDYELGDIVDCRNKEFNISIKKNILEIKEFYDEKGLNLTTIFGNHIPTVYDK